MFARLLIFSLAFSFFSSVSEAKSRPNILVILCDDLGYGDLACYGNKTIQTPHLDQLAAEGIRFTDCYSASPLCSPARAGLLTGRTPSRSGIYSWIAEGNPMNLKRDETTIATLLQSAEYDTCHVGKWHLNGMFNSPEQTQPNDHGFDHWFSTQNNSLPTHRNPKNFVRNGTEVGVQDGFSCHLVADEAIGWLTHRTEQENPFFMFVCFHEPHEPIDSPEDLVGQYPAAQKQGEALYYANVTNMDRAVGRLMSTLDKLNLDEETLVFFTSDNGPETLNRYKGSWRSHGTPGPLRGMKLHVYEGGIRVPGILRWKGRVKPNQTLDTPVSSVDLLPTLCELAEIPLPTGKVLDGTSLVPLLHEEKLSRSKPLFWHYYGGTGNRQVALRDGDWKVVAYWDGPANMPTGGSLRPGVVPALKSSKLIHFELYNLKNDLAEHHDLASQESERLNKLSQLTQQMYSEVINEGPYWFIEPGQN